MARAERRKGRDGEREVADVFERFGWSVRGLESGGDWLCAIAGPRKLPTLHVECKRAEHLRLREWLEQARTEAQPGAVPLLVYRQNRQPWRVVLELETLLELIA